MTICNCKQCSCQDNECFLRSKNAPERSEVQEEEQDAILKS